MTYQRDDLSTLSDDDLQEIMGMSVRASALEPNQTGVERVSIHMVGEGVSIDEDGGPWGGRRVLLVSYDRTGRASDEEQVMFQAAAGLACEIAARMGWALSDADADDEGGAAS